MNRQLIARGLEGGAGELVGAALDLLHGQRINVRALQESQDAVDASTGGVHVPGGQAHDCQG